MEAHILLSPMQARLADGAGVIGNHLVEALFADRHTVTILDNFCTGHRAPLATPLDAPSLRVVQADVNGLSGIPPPPPGERLGVASGGSGAASGSIR